MPTWALPVVKWVGERFLHFVVYAIIGLIVWGVYWKIFVKETNKTTTTQHADDIQNYYMQPHFGCATINAGRKSPSK